MIGASLLKQQLLELLYKSIVKFKGNAKRNGTNGLVQVERTVSKPGITPFRQKFWIKPDQVKSTDIVLTKTPTPQNPPKVETISVDALEGDRTVNFHYSGDFVSGDVISNNPKVIEPYKKIASQITDQIISNYSRHIARMLQAEQLMKFDHVKFPEDLKFDVSIADVNMDGNGDSTITLNYVTSYNDNDVDKDTSEWLMTGMKSAVLSRVSKVNQVEQTQVDGKWTAQVTLHLQWWDEPLKGHMVSQTIQTIKQQINDHLVSSSPPTADDLKNVIDLQPNTDREKEKFSDIIDKATPQQLQDFRNTGICASDSKAGDYLHNLFVNSLVSRVMPPVKINGLHTKKLQDQSLSELKSVLKSYLDNLSKFLTQLDKKKGCLENNEIKTRLSSVSPEVFNQISAQIQNDWDSIHHGHMKYKIHGIYEVKDIPVDDDFHEIASSNEDYEGYDAGGKDCHIDTFYHGTGSNSTIGIVGRSGQFKITEAKVGRMLGDGIYLADKASKSAQYISDDGFTRRHSRGTLMICEASLGNCVFDPEDIDDLEDETGEPIDSVGAGEAWDLDNQEWCVFNAKAVKPKYLIDLELLPREE